jgi:hypothetical protein
MQQQHVPVVDVQKSEPPPLLISSMAPLWTHAELLDLVQQLGGRSSRLLPELALRIVQYVCIERVRPDQVQATACSSTGGSTRKTSLPRLSDCLLPDPNTWWISKRGAMNRRGHGSEYVEFCLSPNLCRLSSVIIQIFPIPAGPYSLRTFVVQVPAEEEVAVAESSHTDEREKWRDVTPVLTLHNESQQQRFDFPEGIDANRVRIVCLSNQISVFLHDMNNNSNNNMNDPASSNRENGSPQQVGFRYICFT